MAVSRDKLNLFVEKFVESLGAVARFGRVVISEKVELSVLLQRVIAAAIFSFVLLAPSPSYSERAPNPDDRVEVELWALGERGNTIAQARGQVIEILQHENACTAWFQEADPNPAEVFRSLHFQVDMRGTSYVYGMKDYQRGQLYKHPWGARSIENDGRNSTIQLNASGPFFNRSSVAVQLGPGGSLSSLDGIRLLSVAAYAGNTPEARITLLLHELGHIIGRLPEDDDSWDGRSSRNSSEVYRHCKNETHAAAHNSAKGNI